MTLEQAKKTWGLSEKDMERLNLSTLKETKLELEHQILTDRSCGQCLSKGWKQDIEALDVLLEYVKKQEA